MKLSDWDHQQWDSYITAWRWFRAGELPVPARQLPAGTILVEAPRPEDTTVLYARVSSAGQKEDLEQQVQCLAQKQGWTEVKIVMEHRDRLSRFGFDLPEAALLLRGEALWS